MTNSLFLRILLFAVGYIFFIVSTFIALFFYRISRLWIVFWVKGHGWDCARLPIYWIVASIRVEFEFTTTNEAKYLFVLLYLLLSIDSGVILVVLTSERINW